MKVHTNVYDPISPMGRFKNTIDNYKFLPEGSKVKLNYEEISSRPKYGDMNKKYTEFIECNKDKIFTVEYDEYHKDKPYLVCLKEDNTKPKWLFHCSLDLIEVE